MADRNLAAFVSAPSLDAESLAGHGKMGIRFYCPNGHKLNVKSFQAGRRGICPFCGAKLEIPTQSTRQSSKEERAAGGGPAMPVMGPAMGSDPGPAPTQGMMSMTAPAGGVGGAMASQPVQPLGEPAFAPAPAGWTPAPAPLGTPVPTTAELAAAAPAQAPPASGGVVDPLAEAPSVVWYVRPPSGGQFGPASGEVMRSWISDGRVSPDSLVWREGWRDWQEASATFPQLGAGQAAPGPGTIAVAATTPGGAASSGSRAGGGYHPHSRQRSNATNVAIITMLVLAVVVLFAVFIWVLFREPAEQAGTSTGAGAGVVSAIDHELAASGILSGLPH